MRWASWKPSVCPAGPMPTRPAPANTCREAKNGVSPEMIAGNGVSRLHR